MVSIWELRSSGLLLTVRYEFKVTYYFNVFQAEDLSHAKAFSQDEEIRQRQHSPRYTDKACIGPLGVTPLSQLSHAHLRCRQRFFASYTLQPSNKFPSLQETYDVHVDRSQIPAVIIHSTTPLWEGFFFFIYNSTQHLFIYLFFEYNTSFLLCTRNWILFN